MAGPIAVGDEAPNFDLTSTEDVVIMLRDEVPRTAVVLYFFEDPTDEASRQGLLALAQARDALDQITATVLGVSPAKLDDLKAVQRDLGLDYPLLRDDRGFAASYGVEAGEGESAAPALFAVNRGQRVVWMSNPADASREGVEAAVAALKALPSPTANLPRKATNWLVDRWVNQKSGLRKKRA